MNLLVVVTPLSIYHYLMRIMATGCTLLEACKETVRICKENGGNVVTQFKYKLPFDWICFNCHAVYDHNKIRQKLTSIEDTWVTGRW